MAEGQAARRAPSGDPRPPSPSSPRAAGAARSCSSRSPASPPRLLPPHPEFQVWHPKPAPSGASGPAGTSPLPGATAVGMTPATPRRSGNNSGYPERFWLHPAWHRAGQSTRMRSHHGQKSKAWWADPAPLGGGISTPRSPRSPQAPPGPHPKSLPSAEAKERGREERG